MLTKTEKKSLHVLLAVTLILTGFYLCFGVLFPDAGLVPYTDSVPDKTRVTFTGEITSVKLTATGGHTLLNVSGVTVFVEGGAENIFYTAGDTIRVVGITDTYAGQREIVVGTAGHIELIK